MADDALTPTPYVGTDNLHMMDVAINYNRFLIRLVLSHAPNGGTLLDYGAGLGTTAATISSLGYSILCVEPDEEHRQSIAALGLTAHGDLRHIEDGTLDYVYSLNVLEHIQDDVAALSLLQKKLKPNGRLFIYVPAFSSLFSSMDLKVGHYRRYTRAELRAKAVEAGFRVQHTAYADSLGYLVTLLYKLIGSKNGDLNRAALIFYDKLVFPVSRLLDRTLLNRFIGKNVFLAGVKSPSEMRQHCSHAAHD